MDRRRLQALVLRATGLVEMLAFGAVVMPRAWMEASHEWLGLGTMPDGPVINFMIRQASFIYGLHGIALWIFATDVLRYRPLVLFTGASYVLSSPVLLLIDLHTGMPWFWTVGDAAGCLLIGLALLALDPGRSSTGT